VTEEDGSPRENASSPPPGPPPVDPWLQRSRALIAAGALLAATGIALAGSVSQSLGGVALLAGWFTMAAGIHRFGRTGDGGG
jgi:hypothetical protein